MRFNICFLHFFKNFQLIVLEAMHNRLTLLLVKWHFICIVPIIQGLNIHHTVHYTFGGQTRTLNPVITTVFMSPLPLLWDSHNFALDIASAFYLLTHFVFFEHLTYWLLTNMLASGFLFDQIKSKVVSRLVGNWGGKSFLFSAKIQNTKKYHRKYANTDLQICWKSDVKEFFFSAKILSPWCAALHLTHSAKASKPTNFLRADEIKPSEGADHSQTTRNFNIISRLKKIILKVRNLKENIQNVSGYPVPRVGLSQICAKAGEARSNLRWHL